MSEKKTLLEYIEQSRFETLYGLIRHREQTLNGFMPFVRRQRSGSKEYGDKNIVESQMGYDGVFSEEERSEKWRLIP